MDYSLFGIFNEVSVKGADGSNTKLGEDDGNNTDFTNLNDDDGGNSQEPAPSAEPPAEDGGGEDSPDFTNMDDDESTPAEDGGGEDSPDFTNMDDDESTPEDGGGEDSPDFTNMDDDESNDGENGEEDGDEEPSEGEDDGNQDSEDGEEGSEEDELAKIEDELFSNLTDEQNVIKDKELKRLYIELYKACDVTINRINAIQKTDENMRVLTFCAKKLIELKDTIDFHINETFWTKLYLDNLITYKTCIAQFNNINSILKKLLPDEKADIEDIEDDKPKELDEYSDEDFDEDNDDDEIKEPESDSELQPED